MFNLIWEELDSNLMLLYSRWNDCNKTKVKAVVILSKVAVGRKVVGLNAPFSVIYIDMVSEPTRFDVFTNLRRVVGSLFQKDNFNNWIELVSVLVKILYEFEFGRF